MSEVTRYEMVEVGPVYQERTEMEASEDGSWVYYTDYAALQQKLDAVLAENVALKEGNELALDIICDENTYVALLWQSSINNIGVETPATDEILNAVRAEAQREFCQHLERYGKVEPYHFDPDFADLYAKISKRIYDEILDNPAVHDMEILVDCLEQGAADSRAYADMAIEHANQLRAGNTEGDTHD